MNGKSNSGYGYYNGKLTLQYDNRSASQPTTKLQEQFLQILSNSTANESNDDLSDDAVSYLDASIDIESILDNCFAVTNDLMAFTDPTKFEQSEFDVLCRDDDGRISLAYERLPGIPKKVAEKFASKIHTLDLSYNNIKDLSFLCNFKVLHTLILDNNISLNERTLPFVPSLRILWLNKCNITNLPKWIQRLKVCTPNIRQLSLMGNPGALSLLNGGSVLENNDYLMYVIANLNDLEYLDDEKITETQRTLARTHIGVYTMSGGPIKFMERFGQSSNIMTFFKYDPKRHRPQMASLIPPRSLLRSKPSTSTGRQ